MEKSNVIVKKLIEMKETYKMIIPKEVERKIRYMCSRFPSLEWSGTLFYKVSGSFESKDLTIECIDFFVMDVGSATLTAFNDSEDIVGYEAQHPELLDVNVYEGLIHSHNKMAAYFSGTDLDTLKTEGNDRNHFVSLIVNNEGNYKAAITKKLQIEVTNVVKGTIDRSRLSYYDSFNNEKKIIEQNKNLGEKILNKTVVNKGEIIQYYYLNIEKEVAHNEFSELEERICDIQDRKKNTTTSTKRFFYNSFDDVPYYKQKDDDGRLFKGSLLTYTPPELFDYSCDQYFEKLCVILITGNLFPDKNITLDNCYINIDNKYKKLFGESLYNNNSLEDWITGICQGIVFMKHIPLKNIFVKENVDETPFIVARELANILKSLHSNSIVVSLLIKELETYDN